MDAWTQEESHELARVFEASSVCFFDCDGVVFDSNGFKVQAMLEVLRDYSEEQRLAMSDYWRNNGGMSRNAKFQYFFENLAKGLEGDALAAAVAAAVDEFGRYSLEGYHRVEPVREALALAQHLGAERAVVVSGAAQTELESVFRHKGIDRHFAEILGSPTKKLDLVQAVLRRRNLAPERAVLIGDGARDFEVCQSLGIYFVYLDCYSEWQGATAALAHRAGRGSQVAWVNDWPTLLSVLGVPLE